MTRTDWGVPPAPSNQDPTPESTADRQQKVEHEPEYYTTTNRGDGEEEIHSYQATGEPRITSVSTETTIRCPNVVRHG